MPKILLVEDDLGLQQLTKDYLEHNGLEVDVLERGDEVFPYLSENHVDLIILDVMLPGKDGFSVCRQVHEHPPCGLTRRNHALSYVDGHALD